MQTRSTHRNVRWTEASRPGALPGWTFRCPRPDCPERHGSTLATMIDAHARTHEQWHKTRDAEKQAFARTTVNV